jgi:glutamate-ammonia-ligase adenylyltransferase
VEAAIGKALRVERDPGIIARDVLEMRQAIADERGDAERWDIKNAAGGLIDIEFLAQYLSLVHATKHRDLLDIQTAQVIEKARALSLLKKADGELLRDAARLYHDLTQVLRLCVTGPFDPAKASPGLLALLARAGGLPDFATLDAHLADTETKVRECFSRLLGDAAED